MPIKNNRKKSKNKFSISLLNLFIFIIIFSLILVSGVVIYIVKGIIDNTPDINPNSIVLDENAQILDSEGNLVEKVYYSGLRTTVEYEDISKDAINAFIAIEDKTFWEHDGFNYVRLLGAIANSISSGGEVQGTSTISQQLARNLYLVDTRFDRDMTRKIREAYYAMKIEDALEKEDIITAYLNTIYLGASANGIEAASHIYFSKSAKELDYIEAAMLATTPSAPSYYQPMYLVEKEDVDQNMKVVGSRGSEYMYVYNPDMESRYKLVLSLMHEQGYISKEQLDAGLNADLSEKLKPEEFYNLEVSSYFSSMVKEQVIEDLAKKYNISEKEATNRLFTMGLTINSTLDSSMQKKLDNIIDDSFEPDYFGYTTESALEQYQSYNDLSTTGTTTTETWDLLIQQGYFREDINKPELGVGDRDSNVKNLKRALLNEGFAGTSSNVSSVEITFDDDGNMVDDNYEFVILYKYKNYFTKYNNGDFIIPSSITTKKENGDVVVERGDILKFYKNDDGTIQAFIKDMYSTQGDYTGYVTLDQFILRKGGVLIIPTEQLDINEDDNLVIKSEAIDGNDIKLGENNAVIISSDKYSISDTPVVQPQLAASIIDYRKGELKAVIGGRHVYGTSLFNRANEPQQIGSSIKPISMYGPALDTKKFTAATPIDDKPLKHNGSIWPYNYDHRFRGRVSMRTAIRDSINVCAVQVGKVIGTDTAIDYLERNGISTLVKEGDANDVNFAALSLGGLTYGIKPHELAAAYGTFGNQGVYIPTSTYTTVVDNKGNVILDRTNQEGVEVFSPQTSYIMIDMMKDVVSYSFGSDARVRSGNYGIAVAGKTGTTSHKMDATFAGLTPYYSAAVWIGNDIDFRLSESSSQAARLYGRIMTEMHEDLPDKEFDSPDDIVRVDFETMSGKLPSASSPSANIKSDLFIEGTQPTTVDDLHKTITVCTESKMLPTQYCPHTEQMSYLTSSIYGSGGNVMTELPGKCTIHTKPPEKKKDKDKDKNKTDKPTVTDGGNPIDTNTDGGSNNNGNTDGNTNDNTDGNTDGGTDSQDTPSTDAPTDSDKNTDQE